MRPKELKVAQPAVPPALETTRPVVEAVVTDREVVVAFVPVAFVKVRPCRDEATLVDVAVILPVVSCPMVEELMSACGKARSEVVA